MKKKLNLYKRTGILAIASILYTLLVTKVDVRPIGPQNTEVGFSHLNGLFSKIGMHMWLYNITEVLGMVALLVVVLFAVVGLAQLIQRRNLLDVDSEILALALIYVILAFLYVWFDFIALNYRPILMEGETFPEPSYPSSHTMLAVTVLGTAIVEWSRLYRKNPRLRNILQNVALVLMIAIVVGRLFSGVHWFTDIVGGVLIGFTLITLYNAITCSTGEKVPAEADGAAAGSIPTRTGSGNTSARETSRDGGSTAMMSARGRSASEEYAAVRSASRNKSASEEYAEARFASRNKSASEEYAAIRAASRESSASSSAASSDVTAEYLAARAASRGKSTSVEIDPPMGKSVSTESGSMASSAGRRIPVEEEDPESKLAGLGKFVKRK